MFRSLNRNKRSIVLDLRKPAAKELVYELVRGVDIVVNNFRAGVMERMGFGYETLANINPRIICAFGSGFGQTGPLAYKGGQDILAQALSGVMRRKCNDDEPLTIYATSLCDYSAGMHLVQAILLALLQREKTGRGQQVAVSLFESMLAMQMQEAAMYLQRDIDFSWGAYPLDRRVSDARRRVGAGRRLQEQSAARHLRGARSAGPLRRCALRRFRRSDRAQEDACRQCSASVSRARRPRIGSHGSTSRTCSARPC